MFKVNNKTPEQRQFSINTPERRQSAIFIVN